MEQTLLVLITASTLHCATSQKQKKMYYLDLVPRICPTTRLDTPIPTIWMEVARPMAVPRVAWGTTRGMDGHMLAWSSEQRFNWLCKLFRNMLHTNIWNGLINIVSLRQDRRWLCLFNLNLNCFCLCCLAWQLNRHSCYGYISVQEYYTNENWKMLSISLVVYEE